MAKRFTDSDKYRKPFLRSLQGAYKIFWDYLTNDCDHAGIWIVDFEVAQIYIGSDMPINRIDALRFFNADKVRVIEIDGGKKWFVNSFIEFQYGELNPANRAHASVISRLKSHDLWDEIEQKIKPLTSPLQGAKEKDRDKEMDKDMVKGKDRGGTGEKEKPPIVPMVVDLQNCTVTGSEWRTDFAAYKSALRQCYQELKKNEAWLAERKRLNPRVDILLTLDKVCIDYWATEEGWTQKRKSKSKSINWKTTLAKSIGQKFNHVYDNGTGTNQTQRRGNALTGDYLADLARRSMSVD